MSLFKGMKLKLRLLFIKKKKNFFLMSSSQLIKKADERVGICKIVGVGLRDIIDADIPANTVNLNLTDNKISDFVGFDENPNLETLILDKNPIFSFRGFPNYPNLKEISMFETPISRLKNFRALVIIAAGKQLSVINGVSVTPNDITSALQFGELSETRNLIVRGWIPKRPSYTNDVKPSSLASVERRTHNKTPTRGTNLMKSAVSPGTKKPLKKHDVEASQLKRVLAVLDAQENDPTSVRAVRVLRAIGYDREGIRAFLREFYSPRAEPKKPARLLKTQKKQEVDPNSLEGQLARQNDTIQILAAKLNAIRFKNRNTNKYDAMLRVAAAPLLENAAILAGEQDAEEDDDYYHFMEQTQQQSQQQQSMATSPSKSPRSASKSVEEGKRVDEQKKAEDSYILLRLAVCDYLKTSPSMGDNILIQLLNDLMEEDKDETSNDEEEEEEEEESEHKSQSDNDKSDSDVPVHYVQQKQQQEEEEEVNDEVPPFENSDDEPTNEKDDEKQNEEEQEIEKPEDNTHEQEEDVVSNKENVAEEEAPENQAAENVVENSNDHIEEEEEDEDENGDSQLVVVIDKDDADEEEEEEDELEDVGIVLKTPVKN